MSPTIDTIKAVFTYLIALVLIIGGGLMLFATRLDPPESNSASLSLVIAGFIGAAVQFVFNQETQTRTARQSTAASVSGATLHANGLAGSPVKEG